MQKLALSAAAAAAWLCLASGARADLRFSVVFNDPQGLLAGYESQIESNVLAAAALWAAHLEGDVDLTIRITGTTDFPRGFGRSVTTGFVATRGGFDVFEQGAASEIRTGVDPNGAADDIEIGLNPDYVSNELWFDPEPSVRSAPVPPSRTDAVTVMLHELGHAFAFNGWMNGFDQTLPGGYRSTWDELVVFDGTNFFFTGPTAMRAYGRPVPVTYGNPSHIANASPRPGSDLIDTLMNGVVFFRGRRYEIGQIELAIFEDVGLPMRTPCAADLDQDEDADVFDLLAYLDLWFAADPAADLTDDASVDVFDLLMYLDGWFAGC